MRCKCGVPANMTTPDCVTFRNSSPLYFSQGHTEAAEPPNHNATKDPLDVTSTTLNFRAIDHEARSQSHTSSILKSRFKNAHNLISKRLTENVYQRMIKR